MFGVPDCGKVCSETHVPGYLAAWDDLRRLGVTRLLCVAVGDAAAADAWASKLGAGVADGSKVTVAADTNGAFTRFMGMDQGPVDGPGARSLRYAAVVDDGTLLKVVRAQRAGWGWGGVGWMPRGHVHLEAGCVEQVQGPALGLAGRQRTQEGRCTSMWYDATRRSCLALPSLPVPLCSVWTRRRQRPPRPVLH